MILEIPVLIFNAKNRVLQLAKLTDTMASSAIDVASLTPDQQAALEQYISFTNQEIEAAIPVLQRSQWNVQVSGVHRI
jgi:hypothetical protein